MSNDELIKYFSMMKAFSNELTELNIKYSEEIEELRDKIISLETEKDVLISKLYEIKADIKYLLEYGEGNGYIRDKYLRGDKE